MTPDEYLKKILEQKTFRNDDQEIQDLRAWRKEIEKTLRAILGKYNPSICWAGSMAKGTMIIASYDGDLTCYFVRDEERPGKTLKEIHATVREALEGDYLVEVKPSALRIRKKNNWNVDLHVDVIPGRYVDDSKSDVFLHRTTGDKQRLKTNLQAHIDHIRDSGVRDAIRLIKDWKVYNGIEKAKTFALELLVVKLLKDKTSWSLSEQLEHVWTQFRDESSSLSVEDPANSNNDLTEILNGCRYHLSAVASTTLRQIENRGWVAVFGEIVEDEEAKEESNSIVNRIQITAPTILIPTRPWGDDI
jgi:tRNA nucleotidyltransferase (CCA-adding enzyme)